jgi:hypothetical protein
MTNPTITIHNQETGEIITREMNADELAQLEIDQKAFQDMKTAREQKEIQKSALLEKLGISEAEAKLLLS